ncbi:hypothetical protein BDB01DRAFT_813818 [Pilobolus umbonatus]|nr:hypothetical protein BDB01DRAFT_813818 [Pilobolus umbonatus]
MILTFTFHFRHPNYYSTLFSAAVEIYVDVSFSYQHCWYQRPLPLHYIKYLKCLVPLSNSIPSSALTRPNWRLFWELQIPLYARTVWYRSIY